MTNDKPLVSVVIPVYNHEKFVKQAIESIVNQTYKNIELFVIDDGSKDKSAEIARELSIKHNFYFETQENKGVISTMNKLLAMCNGKYITSTASDDIFMLDKIEKQLIFMEEHDDVGLCFGNILSIDSNGIILPAKRQYFTGFQYYTFEDIFMFNFYIPSATLFFRKEISDNNKFDTRFKLEDYPFWLNAAFRKYKIVILNDVLVFYRIHFSNSHYKTFFLYENFMQIFDAYKEHALFLKAKRKRLLHYYPFLAIYYKKEAVKMHNLAFSFNINYFISIFLLVIPGRISKFVLKNFFVKLFPEYFYLLNY